MKNQKLKRLLKSALAVAVAVTTLAQPVYAANWVHNNTGWWWHENNGSYPANQWKSIGGTWYWFDSNGYMATGWRNIGGTWYYMDASGAMATGWRNIGGTWYYMDASGAMATGWRNLGGTWYYMNTSGAMVTGWDKIGGAWYYLNSSGAMAANQWVGNYYVESNGAMATSKWIGNYYVDASGLWVETRGQHHGNEGVVTKEPTCGTDGVKTFTCTVCGETYTEVIKATGDHDWLHHDAVKEAKTIVVKEAYDETVWESRYICNGCGAQFKNTTDVCRHILAVPTDACGSFYADSVEVKIHHPAETKTVYVVTKKAYD